MPGSFREHLTEEMAYQKAEIRDMEMELERCDQFDTYKYKLRERLMEFRHKLKVNQEMFERLFPGESEKNEAKTSD